jgi:hypothetical protein
MESHVPTKYVIYPQIIVSVPSAIPSFHGKFTFFLFHQLAPGPPEVYFFTCRSCWATQGGLVDPDPVWSCQNGWPCIASIITEWVQYIHIYIICNIVHTDTLYVIPKFPVISWQFPLFPKVGAPLISYLKSDHVWIQTHAGSQWILQRPWLGSLGGVRCWRFQR